MTLYEDGLIKQKSVIHASITKFAFLPTRMSDRKLVWLVFYTSKLEGEKTVIKSENFSRECPYEYQTIKWTEVERIFE